jgi:hypothetical protein
LKLVDNVIYGAYIDVVEDLYSGTPSVYTYGRSKHIDQYLFFLTIPKKIV